MKVTSQMCSLTCYEKRKVNLSTVFAGQKVGVAPRATVGGDSTLSSNLDPVKSVAFA